MKRIALKVDSKGRIQIPKDVREELGIKKEVSATIENGMVKIEPIESILDRLSKTVQFKYSSVETALPRLRKAAERQLLKEVS
jgi:AbrB family looped-hinge helix DNA binding protein